VVGIDLMEETLVSNVVTQPKNAAMKLSTIVKICKYRGLHERHHFIPMTMEVHNTPGHDMDRFIKKCAHLSIGLWRALPSIIERKIMLVIDAYFRPPITIRSHNLHASDIIRAMGEIVSYHERD
jgi:hypothetical protein